jgi:hypothetical protein
MCQHWRERVNVGYLVFHGRVLFCENELFRYRETAHQSLPSNFWEKLLAKFFFSVTTVHSILHELLLVIIWQCVVQVSTRALARENGEMPARTIIKPVFGENSAEKMFSVTALPSRRLEVGLVRVNKTVFSRSLIWLVMCRVLTPALESKVGENLAKTKINAAHSP